MDDLLLRKLDARDDQVLKAGDTIDVKASIALVVITFLAGEIADFNGASGVRYYLVLVAAISLALAGVLALCELWPCDYQTESTEELDPWLDRLREYYADKPDADAKVAAAFASGLRARTVERIRANTQHNNRKSDLLTWSFAATAVAVLLDLLLLLLGAR